MRVLFVITELILGGAETLLVNLVNSLGARPEFDITVVCLDTHNPLAEKLHPDVCDLVVFPRRWRYDLHYPAWRIADVIRAKRIEAILCFGLYEYMFVKLALRYCREHAHVYVSLHETLPRSLKDDLQKFLYFRLLGREEILVAICRSQVAYLSKRYRIAPERFMVIYGGVDCNHFSPHLFAAQRQQIRQELGIEENAQALIQVAGFRKEKAHENSIIALKGLVDQCPHLDPYLLFVGSGDNERVNSLMALTRTCGVAGRVIFAGAQRDVRPFLSASDIHTLSSVAIESFSQSSLEAMAMGLPCVITDLAGAREMIVPWQNGLLVKPGNVPELSIAWKSALSYTWDSHAIRHSVISNFEYSKTVEGYAELLSGLRMLA